MKKSLLIILVMVCFTGCVVEPPPTWYTFKIRNETNDILLLKYKSIKDSYEKYDTLLPKHEFCKTIITLGCFYNYKDSIINHFFYKLDIKSSKREIKKDIKDYKNWEFTSSLGNEGHLIIFKLFNWNCKSGKCSYNFTINENDISK